MEPGVGKSPPFRDTYGGAGARDKVDCEKIYRGDGKRFVVRADEKLNCVCRTRTSGINRDVLSRVDSVIELE
jgi:hypothetical protein